MIRHPGPPRPTWTGSLRDSSSLYGGRPSLSRMNSVDSASAVPAPMSPLTPLASGEFIG